MNKRLLILFLFVLGTCSLQPLFSQTLRPAEFKKELARQRGVLIDVRTPEEYHGEHIEGAINIDYLDSSLFKTEIGKQDKARAFFLYCGIGKRSAGASEQMKKMGFTEVYNLEKGLDEWKIEGYNTVKSDERKWN